MRGETAGETAGIADGVVGETAAKAGETGMVDKHVAGETAGKPSRSKEAERSARRRAADLERHRERQREYSARSKQKAKAKQAEVALMATAIRQGQELPAMLAKLMDELRVMDHCRCARCETACCCPPRPSKPFRFFDEASSRP